MMARWLCTLAVSALLFGSGCCCVPCGPCGRNCLVPCLPCLPKPIVWNGACNDCSACPGQSCGDYCGGCGPFGGQGLFPWLRNGLSCGRGCSDIYFNEWVSDPPDCCDPCDQCYGQFTGQRGPCCLGPAQRVLSAIHGYRYCPRPNCGPWRPIFGHCNPCGPVCGCGDAGCASCGGGAAHGADVYYDGGMVPIGTPSTKGVPTPQPESTSIMEENWNAPRVKPEPGKPIHNAQQPPRGQMGRRTPQQMSQAQLAARQAAQRQAAIGAGIRSANYEP
jgi:hypothetical protein